MTPSVFEAAEAAFLDLCRTQNTRVLLHGDLHHNNILWDAGRGWLAIDPKGVVGEPEFEMATALKNPLGSEEFYANPNAVSRRVEIMCECLGLDRARVLRWNFAHSVLSALWHIEDGDPDSAVETAMAAARTAHALASAVQ